MNLFIPDISTKMVLSAPWTFTMYMEDRNNKFIGELLEQKWDIKEPPRGGDGYYKYTWQSVELGPVTLPEGTRLSVDRIYIRKGQREYNSITFNANIELYTVSSNKPIKIKGRFWVKLADANKIQMNLL